MQFEAFCKCNSHQYLFVVRKCCDFAKFMHGGNNQRKSQQKHFETEYNRESFTYHIQLHRQYHLSQSPDTS